MKTKKTMEGRKVLSLLVLSAFLFSVLSIFSTPLITSANNNLTINLTGLSRGDTLQTIFYVNLTYTNKAGDGNDALASFYGPNINFTFYMKSALTSNGSNGDWVKIGVNNSVNMSRSEEHTSELQS